MVQPGRRQKGVAAGSEPLQEASAPGPVRRPAPNPGSSAAAGQQILSRSADPAGVSNRALAHVAREAEGTGRVTDRVAAPQAPDDLARVAVRGRTALALARDALPGYRAAVDALDPAAAFEHARVIVDMMRGARSDIEDAAARLGVGGGDARAWEAAVADGAAASTLDWEAQLRLHGDVELDLRDLTELTGRMAFELGPRVFRGVVVAGDPVPQGRQSVEAAATEAAVTIELVNTVRQVRELMGSGQAGSLQQAADLVEGWRGRPVNFFFLYSALGKEGLLGPLSVVGGTETGRNVFQLHKQVEKSAETFGMLLDVGAFNLGEAVTMLSYYWDDWAISDEDGQKVVEMWASASPEARVVILDKLEAEGRLERLCDNVPGLAVKAMADVARLKPNSPAHKTLQAAVGDRPEGTTATELYEQNIMENIEEGNYVRGYLWTFLNVAHSALTLGFKDIHDNAYEQMREGLITSDEYWSTTTKAAGRTAVLLAATAVTGGAVGGFAEGVALGRGVAPTLAGLIGGTVGGGASGLVGQLTADLYDQALLGKEGFSSAGDYLTATGGGAASGALLSGVGAFGARLAPGAAQETFVYHSGGGRYRVLQDFRQGLHGLLYKVYRGSATAGRRVGSGGARTDNAELYDPEWLRHILSGESERQGGHRWPPNPRGGTDNGPKTPFPRTWNDDHIIDVVAEITTNPATVWTQQSGPGQGSTVTGLPTNPPTTAAGAPVRYRTNVVVEGVNIRVVVEPGGDGIITAFPEGFQDPANLLQFVRPQTSTESGDGDEE
jgi:hypothetical protein